MSLLSFLIFPILTCSITEGGKSTYATQSRAVFMRIWPDTSLWLQRLRKSKTSLLCQLVACLHSPPPWANSSAIPVIRRHFNLGAWGRERMSWMTVVQDRFIDSAARAEESWDSTGGEVWAVRAWRSPAFTWGEGMGQDGPDIWCVS